MIFHGFEVVSLSTIQTVLSMNLEPWKGYIVLIYNAISNRTGRMFLLILPTAQVSDIHILT